ncbi:MAG: electron transport complex subunit RsxC [Oscillospiraceae bacterium]|nr:electron transport complex subunit RsxC [Oscillospiraceae bacterium]
MGKLMSISRPHRIRKIKGISPPHHKNTEFSKVVKLPLTAVVNIPMKMHSGKPAIPIVNVGQDVKVGQLIGEMGGYVSAPIHSSVSGCVQSINMHDAVTGQDSVSITIASDGLQTMYPDIKPPKVTTLQEFYDAVRDSGTVGLGGAGFPAAPKLAIKNLDELDYILINGAECEPYVTSDTRAMVADYKNVYGGVKLLLEYMKPRKKIYICIEDNKPEAIRVMEEVFADEEKVEVFVLPTSYPQGERKVLVYNVTGRIVPEGARLADVGVIVTNVTTIAVFARYIATGIPLINKIVTVDGSAVRNPQNLLVPIGTPIRELFDFCGGFPDGEPRRIIVGGPMMGYAQPSLDAPIVKTTNCVLACHETDDAALMLTACIKCGRCLTACPMRLMPPNIESAYSIKNYDALKHFKVNMCVECGSCAYVCPAKRPLVQVMQLSKEALWLQK